MQTTITADNIETIRPQLPPDQARELETGCVTWQVEHDTGSGRMTTWPNDRAALWLGGDSIWGDWDGSRLVTGDAGELPVAYDADGREIAWYSDLQRLRSAGWRNHQIAARCGLTTHTVDTWFMAGANGREPNPSARRLIHLAAMSTVCDGLVAGNIIQIK